MSYADSVVDLQNHDVFEEHAIDTVHTLLLNDNVMPMTFLCETNDYKQILILYFMTDQLEIENKINMVRALMLLNNVERYIFASETLIPSKAGVNPNEDKDAKDGLVFLHADHHGLQKVTQYAVKRRNGQIKLSDKVESHTLHTNTDLDSLLTGPEVSAEQRKELEMIVSTLPRNYPVKAFEYSAKINTYQPHTLN
ncbi:MAG: hypothetical protein OQK75_01965 [Gammaproteobacteria bacterium]|nr:hypothetical protein [Gammaproteobacteria bacterium]MCW8986413.1 hypothetical protein [Gammaproteobacteria bacterium]MCW9032249.1 hypothetical protein [Gammaproteobacteria bacterium]